jgi:hypothetical protein
MVDSAPPLRFRTDDDPATLPWASIILLTVLIVLAIGARWKARQSSIRPASGLWSRLRGPGRAEGSGDPSGVVIESRIQVDPATQLLVVRWTGGRLLLAVGANVAPVVMDKLPALRGQAQELESSVLQ